MIHRPRSGSRQAGLIAPVQVSSIITDRLRLEPIPVAAATALPADRPTAARLLRAALSAAWPQADLLDILPHQATAPTWQQRFGIRAIVERATETVIGDIGFHGPPDESGTVEIGYSVVPDRRGQGFATEAATALVAWVLGQPGIHGVVARCEASNAASIRTLEHVGFGRVGETDGIIAWRRPV